MIRLWLLGLLLSLVAGCDVATPKYKCVDDHAYMQVVQDGLWWKVKRDCLSDPTRDPAYTGTPPSQ